MPRKPKEKKETDAPVRHKKAAAEAGHEKREEKKEEVKVEKKPAPVEVEAVVRAPVSKEAQDDFVPEIPEEYAGEADKRTDRYFESVGRRKTAIARVRMYTRSGDFVVNGKKYGDYFPTLDLQKTVEDALQKMKLWGRFRVSVKVSGGGVHAQSEAVRHGLARSLIKFNPDFRKRLKRAGFLKRDPRAKERKKFGLKKARRAPQWAKR